MSKFTSERKKAKICFVLAILFSIIISIVAVVCYFLFNDEIYSIIGWDEIFPEATGLETLTMITYIYISLELVFLSVYLLSIIAEAKEFESDMIGFAVLLPITVPVFLFKTYRSIYNEAHGLNELKRREWTRASDSDDCSFESGRGDYSSLDDWTVSRPHCGEIIHNGETHKVYNTDAEGYSTAPYIEDSEGYKTTVDPESVTPPFNWTDAAD